MIELSNLDVYNFENAIRGARNPHNSWNSMDSGYSETGAYVIGEKDIKLLQKLCAAGNDHRKFMRQIMLSVDIKAPLYWWKEFDTYKVGVVTNSTSTMHKIHSKPFDADDFSHDHLDSKSLEMLNGLIGYLEELRLKFVETKNKDYWWGIIQLLPSSYNQLRTCSMNYENLRNMYFARKEHKLDEWREFCGWVEREVPYASELICFNTKK